MAGWSKPSARIVKVNCSGVFERSVMKAYVGCVIRNIRGNWVKDLFGMIGLVPSVGASLWSIFYGMKLAWEKGDLKSVIVECDCKEAVDQVNDPDPDFWLADLVQMIENLKNEAWDACEVVHVPESHNTAAATLAMHELQGPGGVKELDDAPYFMTDVFAADI